MINNASPQNSSFITFNVVKNNDTNGMPFVFLATYSVINSEKTIQYSLLSVKQLLKTNKKELLKILYPIQKVAIESAFIQEIFNSGRLFSILELSEKEAITFFSEIKLYEKYGIVCKIPNFKSKGNKILLDINIEERVLFQPSFFNLRTLNYFVPQLIYNGDAITIEEANELLMQDGLQLIKDKWVDVNHAEIENLINLYSEFSQKGLSLIDVIKKMYYHNQQQKDCQIEFLGSNTQHFDRTQKLNLPNSHNIDEKYISILRPYQAEAYIWLINMLRKGFGVCLADDMGLGKTLEVISVVDTLLNETDRKCLIIVPATLVSNWKREFNKFAPWLNQFLSFDASEIFKNDSNIVIMSYHRALKEEALKKINWDIIILDEAQFIKNYKTSTSMFVKSLKCNMKIAMTGTPIENSVLDLWSIFDFINPGLLGDKNEFIKLYIRVLNDKIDLKEILSPFIMRRLKTDKAIIDDLPEKNEITRLINLTDQQNILYRYEVERMNRLYQKAKNDKERHLTILASLTKLKQICNHPSQYYGNTDYLLEESGKFIELKNICEIIKDNKEKVLVFTQFKEIIPALNNLLFSIFNDKGYCIDGDTVLTKRQYYIDEFQKGIGSYMILSLKTAGVGINLTTAQNVIHFDRWWNPAVEDQATDRAYRIGQKSNVMVYKMISADTIEEIIDDSIEFKKSLADKYINSLDSDIEKKLSAEDLFKAINQRLQV